ncbi:MAG: FlgD immunoglobulin-like domain containing protein [Bacteroidota bacterium]
MRLGALIVSILLLSASLFAQKRYVVSSNGDSYLIPKGKSALSIIQRQLNKPVKAVNGAPVCTPSQTFGNVPWLHTHIPYTAFLHAHQDIAAYWYEAPASGTIDSVYLWMSSDSFSSPDGKGYPGKLTFRMHHGNLYTGHGPGYGGLMKPPRECWGYFLNTTDLENGIAAFPDDATDKHWHSTYNMNNWGTSPIDHYGDIVDTTLSTFAPAAEEIYGSGGGGVDVTIHPDSVSGINLGDLGVVPVTAGYPFFLSFKNPQTRPSDLGTNPPYTDPSVVTFLGNDDGHGGSAGGHSDGDPAWRIKYHNFKYYELESYCAKGWIARGDCFLFMWYTMTATGVIPPTIANMDILGATTIQTGNRFVYTDLIACNFNNPPSNLDTIATANLVYNQNGGGDVTVPMSFLGGTTYRGAIPNIACDGITNYHLEVTDTHGNTSQSVAVTYRTLCLRENIFVADTGAERSFTGSLAHSIGRHAVNDSLFNDPSASVIDTASWFTFNKNKQANKLDDGTAGPFAIGNGGFQFCGDTMHYAWVGANGGFALSKTATDTINVNSSGQYNNWDLPKYIHKAPPNDTSLGGNNTWGGVPRNFIAPMWRDFIAGDSLNKWGNVYYRDEPTKWIVEFDSLADFKTAGPVPDEGIFRCILHKDDHTIEFQYDAVGVNGSDSASVVGIQSDSTNPLERPGFILLNNSTFPIETKPRDNWAIRFYPMNSIAVASGWNMLSVAPIPPPTGNYGKSYLFKSSSSDAFLYNAGYKTTATLSNGPGYWLKYNGAGSEGVPGTPNNSVDISLLNKWNMIGSISTPVATLGLAAHPPGTGSLKTAFYGYSGGYVAADFIQPGQAYWVKTDGACILTLTGAGASAPKPPAFRDDLTKLNTITLHGGNGSTKLYLGEDTFVKSSSFYELPPAPPAGIFDARFGSQQQVETYPAVLDKGSNYQYVINIQSSSYPVTVEWNIVKQPDGRQLIITDGINGNILGNNVLSGSGSIRITNASVKSLIVKLGEGVQMPKSFALSQNYPNPFNPTTRMTVEMPKSTDVEIAVYDILGQKVATLLSGQQGAGIHTVEWNGTNQAGLNVPSGTYFVRMISESFTKVQKIMLMK